MHVHKMAYSALFKKLSLAINTHSKISDWQGVGESGMHRRAQRIFRVVKLFYLIPQWWVQIVIHLYKSVNCTIARVNSNVIHRLWVITCIHVDLLILTEVEGVDGGGHMWGMGVMVNLYFLLNFAMKLKLL